MTRIKYFIMSILSNQKFVEGLLNTALGLILIYGLLVGLQAIARL